MGLAIITGAQRGMGKAIALALAEAGYDVAAVANLRDDRRGIRDKIDRNATPLADTQSLDL